MLRTLLLPDDSDGKAVKPDHHFTMTLKVTESPASQAAGGPLCAGVRGLPDRGCTSNT